MYFHDPIKHCRYLKQALSQDKSQIGFFIAAGCPLAVAMPAPQWPLIPDVMGLTKAVAKSLLKKKDLKYAQVLEAIKLAGVAEPNIEQILSFVRALLQVAVGDSVRGFTESELKKLDVGICEEIVGKIDVELPQSETPYHRLANWIRSVQRGKPVEVFTTNYDLLVEQALESYQVPYFDGFVGSRTSFFDLHSVENDTLPVQWTRLWKIHGSLNWFKTESGDVTRSSKGDKGDEQHLIYPSHLKYNESRKMPFLALIDRLSRFIWNKGATLIINGYSFNDDHLNDCIYKALQSNPTAVAFAPLFGKLENYPNARKLAEKCPNLTVLALDRGIVGTTEAPWAIVQPLAEIEQSIRFMIANAEGETSKGYQPVEFSIGDFNNLSLFLKYLISEDHGGIANEN